MPPIQKTVTARAAFAALLMGSAPLLGAQTSGTLGVQTSANWNTASWSITAGAGSFPDAGGSASFLQPANTFIGALTNTAAPTITLTAPVNLLALTFDTPFQVLAAGSAVNNLTLSSGALNVVRSNVSSINGFAAGHVLNTPIAGAAGLTKSGAGILTVGGTNSYTGGTTINGGTLRITSGDAALGATGAGNDLSVNNATFRVSLAALTTSRSLALSGVSTLELFANTTLNGAVSGSGTLIRDVGSVLALTAANTYSGAYVQRNGTTTLSGANGSFAAVSSYDLANTLILDNTAALNSNRLSDTAGLTARGLTVNFTGNAGANSAEQAGALTLASGVTVVNIAPGTGRQASLNFANITRAGNAVLSVRGSNLGATPASGVAQFGSTVPTAGLVGGAGAAGTTTVSVLPWATGNVLSAGSNGSSFVTVDGTGNFRPLNLSTEYLANTFTGATQDSNLRVSIATATPAGGATVNSLLVQGSNLLTTTGSDSVTVRSGAFLYSPAATTAGTVSANLNFGTAEGVVNNTSALTVSGVISGSNGLTRASANAASLTLTGANTYTGTTTLLNGQTTFAGTVSNDGITPGPLGLATSPVVVNAGVLTTRIWVSGATTFNRDLLVTGASSGLVGFGTTAAGFGITMNGAVVLNRQLTVESGSASTETVSFNGTISGPGSLTDAFASRVALNTANTYSGGTEIVTGTYIVGNNAGFGSGPVYVAGLGFIQAAGARTVANPLVFSSNLTVPLASDSLTFTGAVNLNSAPRTISVATLNPVTFSGNLSDGGLVKTEVGTITLNRATGNDYSGGSQAQTGTLNLLNSSGSATGTGTLQVQPPARLTGSFNVAGATSLAGTLSPGDLGNNAIGTASFASDLTMAGTGLVNFELASLASFDRLRVGGALTLAGNVTVSTISGFSPAAGASFDLIDWGSLTVSGFALPTNLDFSGAPLGAGLSWDSSRFLVDGTVQVVPEPSTWLMLAGGLLGVVALSRRRRG